MRVNFRQSKAHNAVIRAVNNRIRVNNSAVNNKMRVNNNAVKSLNAVG